MDIPVAAFDWDDGNREKCRKHGVSIEEIEHVLSDRPLVAPDIRHSGPEDRFVAVGRTPAGRPLFVAFTIRGRDGRDLLRPVSARYMHRREIARYEAQGTEAED